MENLEQILSLEEERRWCVYIHTNVHNGKKYIGITSKAPENRWGINGSKYLCKRKECCKHRKKCKTAGGFVWIYEEEYEQLNGINGGNKENE